MQTRAKFSKVKNRVAVTVEEVANHESGAGLLEEVEEEYARCKEGEAQDALSQALPKLLTHGLTEEQVWQQLELQNRPALRRLARSAHTLLPPSLLVVAPLPQDLQEEDEEGQNQEEEEDQREEQEEDTASPTSSAPIHKPLPPKGEHFFSLAEMDRFCDAAEAEDFLTGDLDLDGNEEDGEDGVYYDDFFHPPSEGLASSSGASAERGLLAERAAKRAEEEEEEEDEMEEKGTSSHWRKQARLAARIAQLEEENLAPKSWQMAGEVAGRERPENSLLSEHLSFQHKAKGAPVITADSTERLEAMLLQRIKDKTWDDVQRKEKVMADPAKFRADLILDQEKSKVSLADVYEKEFLKQTQAKEESEENPRHVEIQRQMTELFRKLDALSNYHYTPKQPLPQLKVVKKVAQLSVEDGLSAETAATAELLAPEEVLGPGPLTLKAAEEAETTERRRERRRKKARQRAVALRREAAATRSALPAHTANQLQRIGKIKQPKLDRQAAERGSAGAAFFGKLESKVRAEIAAKAGLSAPSAKKTKKSSGAAFKLA